MVGTSPPECESLIASRVPTSMLRIMNRWARALPSALALLALTAAVALAAGPPFPDPVDDQAVYDTADILAPRPSSSSRRPSTRIEGRSGAEVVGLHPARSRHQRGREPRERRGADRPMGHRSLRVRRRPGADGRPGRRTRSTAGSACSAARASSAPTPTRTRSRAIIEDDFVPLGPAAATSRGPRSPRSRPSTTRVTAGRPGAARDAARRQRRPRAHRCAARPARHARPGVETHGAARATIPSSPTRRRSSWPARRRR